ncbi:MAG TPA: glutamyl-tRNA amidotransferase [Cryomorphaceae bacterium]|nr:glutamyl-tRNA amidotransferase [Cryomorphaceae bacterium]|tara:strand:- start:3481 stop:3927 length:447 start_codon:yes stop_codon:yes gene_type:complete
MALEAQITADLKTAMKAKDKVALEALRAIKTALLNEKTAAGAKEMTGADELKLLTKLRKQRVESAIIFREQGREDLAEPEEAQIKIIERYLPDMLSEEVIEAKVKEIIAATGASSMADMGKVMEQATGAMAGQADGKVISGIVRKLLS